ncbi:guanine nucleotide binding protein, alpha subunit [Obelidium mucronatum]|nr:guanine nucleotide binding protein, alpha subunit [Obelidium mucronatum]
MDQPLDPDSYAEWKAAKQISDQIDADLKKEAIAKQKGPKGPKLILLGSGDSGKSTVLKQLKILRGGGFTDAERHAFKLRVWNNIIDSMKMLVSALDTLEIDLGSSDLKIDVELVKQFILGEELPENIVEAIRKLWKDSGIQSAVKRANELPEYIYTSEYYLNDLEKHTKADYVPSDEDILRVRTRTTTISETNFTIDNKIYTFYDVGGQMSLRQFWAPYFADDLSAIIFVAALSSYDQMLLEDPTVNRMEDAIALFGSVCNNKLLQKTAIILFLNKVDLLQQKVESGTSPVEKYFPYYTPRDYKETGNWFKQKFHDQKKSKNTKAIYTHFTTGTDTKNMDAIISAVQDIVLKSTLNTAGVL